MKQLYQIHNVGVYIDDNDKAWEEKIEEKIKEQFDGFQIYKGVMPIEQKLIIHNLRDIDDKEAIVVPECSRFLQDKTFISEYIGVGYRVSANLVDMWTDSETWYAPYLLELLFIQQGITFVHGASVAVDKERGILLLAFGGIGKTCFVAKAAKKERVTLLGDDLILVSSDGRLYSYPRPFCLYGYHKELFPEFFKEHKYRFIHYKSSDYILRIIKKLKEILNIKSNTVYSFLPVSPLRLLPKEKLQIEPVKLEKIYILRRNNSVNKIKCSNIDENEKAVNFATDVIFHEWDLGMKIILNREAQMYGNIIDYIDLRRKILLDAFQQGCKVQCLDIPENMSATDVSQNLNNIILAGIE